MTKNTQTGRTKTSRLAPEEMTPRATLPFGQALCKECDKILPQADFAKKGKNYLKTCRTCYNAIATEKMRAARASRRVCPSCNKKQFPRFFEFRDEGEPCTKCVPQDRKRCTHCKATKGFDDFYTTREGYLNSVCKPCSKKRFRYGPNALRKCRGCKAERPRAAFGESRWEAGRARAAYRNQGGLAYTKYCLDCKPDRPPLDLPNLRYDYSFGRTVLDYTHDQTVLWLAIGYRHSNVEHLSRALESAPVHWEPDPIEDLVSA
jgi:hypothetical protein